MSEDKKPKSRLKDNCYADMEVILHKGDDFEDKPAHSRDFSRE